MHSKIIALALMTTALLGCGAEEDELAANDVIVGPDCESVADCEIGTPEDCDLISVVCEEARCVYECRSQALVGSCDELNEELNDLVSEGGVACETTDQCVLGGPRGCCNRAPISTSADLERIASVEEAINALDGCTARDFICDCFQPIGARCAGSRCTVADECADGTDPSSAAFDLTRTSAEGCATDDDCAITENPFCEIFPGCFAAVRVDAVDFFRETQEQALIDCDVSANCTQCDSSQRGQAVCEGGVCRKR